MRDPLIKDTSRASIPIKKKRKTSMRKAPQAPKRFKSSYILFFLHVQVKIQDELGGKVSVRILFNSIIFLKDKPFSCTHHHIHDESFRFLASYLLLLLVSDHPQLLSITLSYRDTKQTSRHQHCRKRYRNCGKL